MECPYVVSKETGVPCGASLRLRIVGELDLTSLYQRRREDPILVPQSLIYEYSMGYGSVVSWEVRCAEGHVLTASDSSSADAPPFRWREIGL